MPEPNSMNTGKGKTLQSIAAEVLGYHFQVKFQIEHPIPIGHPPKITNLILSLIMAFTLVSARITHGLKVEMFQVRRWGLLTKLFFIYSIYRVINTGSSPCAET